VVAGVLHRMWSKLPHQGNTLDVAERACGHTGNTHIWSICIGLMYNKKTLAQHCHCP
jgi:hypothetical protein